MILVVGATGSLGGDICRRLTERGERVRALVRRTSDPARVELLRGLGAELVEGDLRDRASLDAACRGARVVVSTATTIRSAQPGDSFQASDEDGQKSLVDAARAAGVAQFIFISFSGNMELEQPLHHAKRGVERHLRESGMTYTILRPSLFMEVWLSPFLGFDARAGTARVLGSGDEPISWISQDDVAAIAVACVDNPKARDTVLELGGPEAVSWNEVVRIFEEASGRTFQVERVPAEALRQQYEGAEDPMQKTFAGMMYNVAARGDAIDVRPALERVPARLTSVREYARRVTGG